MMKAVMFERIIRTTAMAAVALGLMACGLMPAPALFAQEDGGIPQEVLKDAEGVSDEDLEQLLREASEGEDGQETEVAPDIAQEAEKDVQEKMQEKRNGGGEESPALTGGIEPGTAEDDVMPQPEELTANQEVRRKELELIAEHHMIRALQHYRKEEFGQAAELYRKAREKLQQASKSAPRILKKVEQINDLLYNLYVDWAEALASDARRLASAEKYDQAMEKAEEAAEYDPTRREDMDKLRKRYMELKRETEIRAMTKPSVVDPGKVERDFEINVLFEQGKVFFQNQRFADARDLFEQILLEDPYDVRAMRWLRKINEELTKLAKGKHNAMIAERMAEVKWKWAEPVTPLLAGPAAQFEGGAIRKTDQQSNIRNKLNTIIIPSIEFEDVPITDVIKVLKRRSMEHDPDGEGVNIFLQLSAPTPEGPAPGGEGAPGGMQGFDEFGGGAPGGAPGGEFGGGEFGGDLSGGDFGGGAVGGDFGGGMGMDFQDLEAPGVGGAPGAGMAAAQRTITMNMDNIPLGEIIRYICLGANLKWRIEEHAVIIADKSVPLETMETRFYNVEAGVLDARRTRAAQPLSLSSGDDDDDDTTSSDTGDDDDWGWSDVEEEDGGAAAQDLMQFFYDFGISFPQGARISYYQRTGKLVVHNTPENLRKIEKVLQEINVTPTQVTIEAKFVEVVQNDLQTLGFDWLLLRGAQYNPPAAGVNDAFISGQPKLDLGQDFQIGVQKDTRLTRGVRFASDFLAAVEAGSDELLGTYVILGDLAFETIVHALQQQGHADILSAPKVTALSGNTAVLRMVTERYFPDEWTEPEVTAGSETTGASFKPSVAEFGDSRDIGVILEVTPTVAADGYSIDLELRPQVIDFIEYDDSFNYTMVVNGEEVLAKQLMPIISARTVETKVIVWDGETVVLGGMIGERVDTWNDKVPVLGDVPLLGRLFRATGESTQKTNLLIFVTARLVNPAGLPIRANEMRGLPDFRH